MKRIILGAVVFYVLVSTSVAYAHSPVRIVITFDSQTRILEAVIAHPVANPESHYIMKVDIGRNGEEIIEHRISRQDNTTTQTVKYLIPDAKKGDTISVEAYCNISGKRMQQITVE